MNPVYAIYNETQKKWWVRGYSRSEPCCPYLWYDKTKAERHLEGMDAVQGWTEMGDKVTIVEFELVRN